MTKLISFCDEMTGLEMRGEQQILSTWTLVRFLAHFPHKIHIDKLLMCGLGRWTVRWT